MMQQVNDGIVRCNGSRISKEEDIEDIGRAFTRAMQGCKD